MKKTFKDYEFLDSLTALFLAEGIKRLSVGEIASRLHCSRRRLYSIAKTKEEIFCAIVERFFQSVLDQGDALIRSEPNLTSAIAIYLDLGVRMGRRIGVLFLKDLEESEPARIIFDNYQQARTFRLSELIDEGVRQGVFVPCHGLLVAEVILGAALRLRRPAFLSQAGLSIEAAFQEFYRVFLNGLLADATVPKAAQSDNKRADDDTISGQYKAQKKREMPDL